MRGSLTSVVSATEPAVVGEPLAQALGALLCGDSGIAALPADAVPSAWRADVRWRRRSARRCFTCRRRGRAPLSANEYQAIGQALEQLVLAAP